MEVDRDQSPFDGIQLEAFKRGRSEQSRQKAQEMAGRITALAGDADSVLAIADLGGGDGVVLDYCLKAMPRAKGILVDLAQEMVDANDPNPRKTVIRGNLLDLKSFLPAGMQFDIILFNGVLHHCLGATAAGSRAVQQRILEEAADHLSPTGRILVFEQIHESPVLPDLASLMIYFATRSRMLAPVVRHGGANTAGVGVLFASEGRLLKLFRAAALDVAHSEVVWTTRKRWIRMLIGVARSYSALYMLEPSAGAHSAQ